MRQWWTVFNDPMLDQLIEESFKQNLSLQIAGLRILEARAQLGIVEGRLYPQTQQLNGEISNNRISENGPNYSPLADDNFSNYQAGFDAAWEIDFWGRFARGIQADQASLDASFADYDDALVSLAAEVARSYVNIRTLETQIKLAQANIKLQSESLRIAQVRHDNGATSNLDVQQDLWTSARQYRAEPDSPLQGAWRWLEPARGHGLATARLYFTTNPGRNVAAHQLGQLSSAPGQKRAAIEHQAANDLPLCCNFLPVAV